ncbi:MAG: CPBP family intramembrane glutamic endopeptidase [Chloroflexota bacterium]
MMNIQAFMKRHAVLTYFVLTFAISWGGILIAFGPGGIPASLEQLEKLGPSAYLAMLAGPSVASILLTGLIDGRAGMRGLLARLLRWRVGAGWYAVALLTTPLLATVVPLALLLLSPEFLPGIFTTDDKSSLLLSGLAAGLMVGIFEELGWTGFAIPRLRLRYGILTAGLIVGLLWGAWHFLLFWESDSFFGALPLALLLERLFSWLPPFRILMVWVYDRTESLLVVMLMHASLVASQVILMPATISGIPLLIYILIWAAALWIAVGCVGVAHRGQLSQKPLQSRTA